MSAALQPGSSISHYRIVSRLGAGGMGEVYLARDETLERSVALKIIPPDRVGSEERVRRFVQEAKSASALNHPNIVTIHEIGRAEVTADRAAGTGTAVLPQPIHFIAMELISGHTLRHLIHDEKTDLRTLLGYLAQAADGLARAHASGIVHRDIKPENIMVTKDGFAKILDFGLAKLVERREATPDATDLPTATKESTREGVLLGTISYMSPEQIQGRPVDHRADIFAFGCVLYEATTRRRAFAAETDVETLHKILKENPAPIEELNPQAPAVLRRLVRRCLAKNPEQRLQSMKDLALELSEIVQEFDQLSASESSGSGATAAPGALRGVPRLAWAGIIASVLVVAVAVGIATRGLWERGRSAAAPEQRMRLTRLTTDGSAATAAISPDGRYLAHVSREKNGYGLRVMQIATGSDVALLPPSPERFSPLRFSPEGDYICFVRGEPSSTYGSLYQIPTLGGRPRRLVFDIDSPVSFSPDGRRMVFLRFKPTKSMLVIADADGTHERILVTLDSRRPEMFGYSAPAWSPDGKRIVAVTVGPSSVRIETFEEPSARRRQIGDAWAWAYNPLWLPDGRGLVLVGARDPAQRRQQIWYVSYPAGVTTRVTNDLNDYYSLTLSADGKTLAAIQSVMTADVWTVPSSGPARATALTSASSPEASPPDIAPGPAGSVLYSLTDDRGARIVAHSLSGGSPRVCFSTAFTAFGPRWAARESTIAFTASGSDRVTHVWRMNADGGDLSQVTSGSGETLMDCSPDGQWVYFERSYETGVWRAPAQGGPAMRLADTTIAGGVRVSPDGGSILCARSTRSGGGDVLTFAVEPAAGGAPRWTRLRPTGLGSTEPEWVPDGRALSYALNDGAIGNIWLQPLDQSPPRQLTRFDDLRVFAHAWALDGRTLYVVRGRNATDAVLLRDFR